MRIPYPLRAPWAITEHGMQLVLAVWSRGEAYSEVLENARARWEARKAAKAQTLEAARARVEAASTAHAKANGKRKRARCRLELRQAQASLDALLSRDGEPLAGAQAATLRDGIAVIPVSGPLIRHASMFDDISGVASYESIRKDLQVALDSDDVKAILFDIDSPGGEVSGCGELSKAIFEARSQKPIWAYASGMLCSAAYWIGSAASRVVVDPSAIIGSIGVRTALIDDSKRDDAQGIKEYTIVSDQSPLKVIDPASSDDRARVKAQLTSMAAVFIGDVARNRAVTDAAVMKGFGKGDVFIGAEAVAAGLADQVGDIESVIASMQADVQTNNRSFDMGASQKPAASIGDEKCDGCGRAMDDDDDTYCRACHSEADASAAFQAEVLSLTGKPTAAEARAVLAGWKQASEEVGTLRAHLATLETKAAEAAYEATVKEFRDAGVIPPAADHKRSKYVASLKGKPDAAAQVRAYCETLDPLVPATEATPPAEIKKPTALQNDGELPPIAALSEDDKKMLASAGYKPEQIVQLAEERAKRAAK